MRSTLGPDDFSWFCALLVGLYGLASWLVINGLWVELPLLVTILPEGWNLPSYLIIIIQIANFAPLLYVLLSRFCRVRGTGFCSNCFQPPDRFVNYIILTVGFICCILLANFWQVVIPVPGLGTGPRSVGLIVIALFMAVIDCTSTVSFIAYLSGLHQSYVGALTFGEALSDLVPSIIALIQGADSEPKCINVTVNGSTQIIAEYAPPRFSVELFFYVLAIITAISIVAFCMLDLLPFGLGQIVQRHYLKTYQALECSNSNTNSNGLAIHPDDVSTYDKNTNKYDPVALLSDVPPSGSSECQVQVQNNYNHTNDVIIPLLIIAYISAISFGFLPSLQSYSCASYDILTYHLAVTLSGIACAISIVIMTLLFNRSTKTPKSLIQQGFDEHCETVGNQDSIHTNKGILGNLSPQWIWFILVLISIIPSGYVVYLARSSPNPPHMGGFGPALAVITWIVIKSLFTIIRTWIWLHLSTVGVGPMIIRFAGLATQAGAFLGAICSFLIVAYFNVFQKKIPCLV